MRSDTVRPGCSQYSETLRYVNSLNVSEESQKQFDKDKLVFIIIIITIGCNAHIIRQLD